MATVKVWLGRPGLAEPESSRRGSHSAPLVRRNVGGMHCRAQFDSGHDQWVLPGSDTLVG